MAVITQNFRQSYNAKTEKASFLTFLITDVPGNFKEWVSGNQQRFENKKPLFLQQNQGYAIKIFLKKQRTEIKSWAKENLIGKSVFKKEVGEIQFSVIGIKEALNQPHKHIYAKNETIKDIVNLVKNGEYKGVSDYKNRTSHIIEVLINNEKSWIIVNQYAGKGIYFYSISDSDKVMKNIKKPK